MDTIKRPRFSLRVLIVEDGENIRAQLHRTLQKIGISSVQYTDQRSALAVTAIARPDLILADLAASPADALAFARSVRQSADPNSCKIPILLLTNCTERNFIEAARDRGIDAVLLRPLTTPALRQKVDGIINQPRRFVRSHAYLGPCRRRRVKSDYQGPERRGTEAASTDRSVASV